MSKDPKTTILHKEVVIRMIKTEEKINLGALAYNLVRLYNIEQEIKNTKEGLEDFYESTSNYNNNILKKTGETRKT